MAGGTRGTIPAGHVHGVPVGLHWSVLVIVLVLGELLAVGVLPAQAPGTSGPVRWAVAAVACAGFVLTVALHELAHAAVARRSGIEVLRVTVWVVGGSTETIGEPRRPGTAVAVAAAGPVASVGLGAVLLGVAGLGRDLGWPAVAVVALAWLGSANVLLAVFNALPVAPMDGGRVLQGVCWWFTGDRARGRRAANTGGRFCGGALVLVGAVQLWTGSWAGLWPAAIGFFVAQAASAQQAREQLRAGTVGRIAREAMQVPATVAQAGQTVASLAGEVLGRPSDGRVVPVVDIDGHPTGWVARRDLAPAGLRGREGARVLEITRPLPPGRVVHPDTPLDDVADLAPLPGGNLMLVVAEYGRVVGLVELADLVRRGERSSRRGRARAVRGGGRRG